MDSQPPHNHYLPWTTAANQETAHDSPTNHLDVDLEATSDMSQPQYTSSNFEESNDHHPQLTSETLSIMPPIPIDPRILGDTIYTAVPYDPATMTYTSEMSATAPPSPSSDPASSPPPVPSTPTTATPPPDPPLRPRQWKWQCHRCHRRIPATSGRCLCGHRRCNSRSTPEERSSNSDHRDKIRKRYRDSAPRFGRPGEQFFCKTDERWRTRLLEILETDGEKGQRNSWPSGSAAGKTARGVSESVNTTTALTTARATQSPRPHSSPPTAPAQENMRSATDTNTSSESTTTSNKRKRAAKEEKMCTVSFDFARWHDYGEWRRVEKRARLVREMDAESDAQEAWAKANAAATAAIAAAVVVAAATAAAAAAIEVTAAIATTSTQDDTSKTGEGRSLDKEEISNEQPEERGEHQETHQSQQKTTTTTTTNSYLDTLFLRDDSPPSEFDELFGILAPENDVEHESAAAAVRLFLRDDSPAYAPGLFAFTEEELEPQPQQQEREREQKEEQEQKDDREYDPESPPFTAQPAAPAPLAPATPAPEPAVLPPRPPLEDWRAMFVHDCAMDCDYPGQCRRKRRSEGAEKAYHDGVVEKSRAAFRK